MSGDKYDWHVGELPPTLEEHSATKHSVLSSYITRYIEVLTSNPRRDSLNLTLIDGFAGGGAYHFHGDEVPGSPMILLKEIACAQARLKIERRKQFQLKAEFIFVERSLNNKKFLEQTIRASEHAALVGNSLHIVNDEFEQAVPGIIESIRQRGHAHRSIFFLDQYGYTQVSLQTIRTILSSLQNPEIIVTFNVDSLIDYMSKSDKFLKAVKPVELAVSDMLRMKDQTQSRWLIQNSLSSHLRQCTAAPYYTCFFIKCPNSHRSYWLIHISKHHTARDEMAMLHWGLSNHFVHYGMPGLNMLGFDPDQNSPQTVLDFMFDETAETRSRAALATELLPLIYDHPSSAGYPQTLQTLFSKICNDTPTTAKQIGSVLVDYRNHKEIEIMTVEGRPKPRSDRLNWTDIILPARQSQMFTRQTRR